MGEVMHQKKNLGLSSAELVLMVLVLAAGAILVFLYVKFFQVSHELPDGTMLQEM
jgi:hypothetical protein